MVAKEPWEEKCIGRQDVVSAWVLVLIESVAALVIFGLLASVSCSTEPTSRFKASAEDSSYQLVSSGAADDAPRPGAGRSC
jgi:hypothetical protein